MRLSAEEYIKIIYFHNFAQTKPGKPLAGMTKTCTREADKGRVLGGYTNVWVKFC